MNPPSYLPGVSSSNGGFQFELKGCYALIPDFFSIGAATSYMMVNSYAGGSGEYSRRSIPLLALGQLEFGPIYALVGFGFHFWTGNARTGSDLGMVYGGGYLYDLGEDLAFDAGLRLHTIFADNALLLTLNIGIVYSL